jgi:hypothetical protein
MLRIKTPRGREVLPLFFNMTTFSDLDLVLCVMQSSAVNSWSVVRHADINHPQKSTYNSAKTTKFHGKIAIDSKADV